MADRFVPEPRMLGVLRAAYAYLYEGDLVTARSYPVDPKSWCESADVPFSRWTAWVDHYGDAFLKWFGEELLPSELERYAMDALWWRNWRVVLTNDKASAAHLKAWGEMRGHFDERPPPPPVRHLSSDEALAEVVKLGPDVLTYALEEAIKAESLRRGQDPTPPPEGH